MDVRGPIKLALSGTERREGKRGVSVASKQEWDSETETWGQYFCQLWQWQDSDARNKTWIRLPAWLSLVLWKEPGWRAVEGHYSVLCLCQFLCYQQSLVCVLGWIQGFFKFMSFVGPCSDRRVTSVTQDPYTNQNQGGDAQHRIISLTSQVLPKATREF